MLSLETANQLACSIVASRLDYCNSLLVNTASNNINKLQSIQNNLARILCNIPARANAAPLLMKLHWLPIEQQITYKIATLTFKALQTKTPSYLHNVLTPYASTRSLHSSQSNLLTVPHTSNLLTMTDKAFPVSAPKIWNNLSPKTR